MYHRKGLSLNFLGYSCFSTLWKGSLEKAGCWYKKGLIKTWGWKIISYLILILILIFTSYGSITYYNSNNCAFRKWVAYTLLSVRIAQCLNSKLLLHHTGIKLQTCNCIGFMLQNEYMVLVLGSLFHVMYKIPERLLLVMI